MTRRRFSLHNDRPRIEIIPMIDVMMFLLIFFMIVTLHMIAGSGIQVELPRSSTAQSLKSVRVTIGVDRNGKFYADGQPTTPEGLASKLQAVKAQHTTVDTLIVGDQKVELQRLIDVMDIVRANGITSVGIATVTTNSGLRSDEQPAVP